MSLIDLHKKIDELYELYKNDDYMKNRLFNIINNDLSTSLINIKTSFDNRENRKNLLQEAHNLFVSQFINNNKYFYNNTSEIFFYYDNESYSIIKEDTIIYNIFTQLRYRSDLFPWKYKIKTSIIKNIKDISILNSLPESNTIQNVQNIFMKIFNTKNEIKFFLTVLGDILFKKNDNNIHIISNNFKSILRTIENIGSQYFGQISISNQFKYKYHDHNYNNCRILVTNLNENVQDDIFKNIINIIVVACYYSNKHNNADNFLEIINDKNLINRILFLKNNTQESIIDKFIDSKIQDSDNSIISIKNMLYLWKLYLEELEMPYIIPIANLKNILKTRLKYDIEEENFINYTSIKIPFVSKFIHFWDDTTIEDLNEYYLEIDEICILFKNYCGINSKHIDINDNSILNLIKHFYPSVIVDGKYITNVSSNQWNKQNDIIKFISKKYSHMNANLSLKKTISLYELYTEYSTIYCKKNKNLIVISKTYFDLFLHNILSSYDEIIDFNTIPIKYFYNLSL